MGDNMQTIRALRALAVLVVVWMIGFAIFAYRAPAPPGALEAITRSNEFKMGLHDRGTDGCVALPYQNPDLIVMGSSHAYAALDMHALKGEMEGMQVGLCALPLWNTDFLRPFRQRLERKGLKPSRIVWILDAAGLSRLPDHTRRLSSARIVLEDGHYAADLTSNWLKRHEEGEPPLAVSERDYAARFDYHAPSLAGLDPARVTDHIGRHADIFSAIPKRVFSELETNPSNAENIRSFCDWIERSKIRLDVVMTPLPRPTLLSSAYDPQKAAIDARAAIPCATYVIEQPLDKWGLDIRHYLNRKMVADYDYELWTLLPDAFDSAIADMSRDELDDLYNPDHLNPVGANIFTRHLADILKESD